MLFGSVEGGGPLGVAVVVEHVLDLGGSDSGSEQLIRAIESTVKGEGFFLVE